jgi:hypothetical protein
VSSLVPLPDFVPGLGTLYVDPTTLPVGPFLAYDRQGHLVSTVYMISLRDLRAGKAFNILAIAHLKANHIDIYYNNGHPGVPDPHYPIVLCDISAEQAATLQYATAAGAYSVCKGVFGYAGRGFPGSSLETLNVLLSIHPG